MNWAARLLSTIIQLSGHSDFQGATNCNAFLAGSVTHTNAFTGHPAPSRTCPVYSSIFPSASWKHISSPCADGNQNPEGRISHPRYFILACMVHLHHLDCICTVFFREIVGEVSHLWWCRLVSHWHPRSVPTC